MSEWLHLFVRWFHVLVGALWIGQTFFFSWLDGNMKESGHGQEGEGEVWMVHSGGFYRVEKQPLVPEQIPSTLHWFRWEAAFTWISGILLLVLVYYLGGALVESGSSVSEPAAIVVGLGALIGGWLVYDLLWISPLTKNETLGALLSLLLVVALAYGLTQVLSGRAAFIHVGALLGTLMAANVWMRILPGQRRLIAATQEGRPANPELARRAKQRSKHNTFMTVPLVFIMVSNHFPTTSYGHRYNWLLLGGFILAGWGARRLMLVWGSRS